MLQTYLGISHPSFLLVCTILGYMDIWVNRDGRYVRWADVGSHQMGLQEEEDSCGIRQPIRIKLSCVFSILACVGSLLEKINHNSSMQHLCSHHGKGSKCAFQAKMLSILPGKKKLYPSIVNSGWMCLYIQSGRQMVTNHMLVDYPTFSTFAFSKPLLVPVV